ncbi:MAG: hypothetical protein WC584_02360 [Candidatus Pacearchaeota archaeon]
MKRVLLVVLIVVIAAVLFFASSQFTGKATLTSNANYGPIDKHKYFYVDCVYLSDNDGWNVIEKGKVKYFNRLKGLDFIEDDSCLSSVKVRELDCSSDYMVEREVTCPPSMVCKEGICVTPNF